MVRCCSVILFLALWISCTSKKDDGKQHSNETPLVAVVNYPLYYFAKSIAGNLATIYFPFIDGDPSHWKPDARQVIKFQRADIILANGAGYAKWMEKVSLPTSKIVNTAIAFKDQWVEIHEEVTHSHGPEGEHSHTGLASTTWLNFKFAAKQAELVYEALRALLPEQQETLELNFNHLCNRLENLDEEMKKIAEKIGDSPLLSPHPIYQYLRTGYGLNIIDMHWDPHEIPSKNRLKGLEEILAVSPEVSLMIWEDEPIGEVRLMLEKFGISSVVFTPCANAPEGGDFINVMDENLERLADVVKNYN